MSIPTPLSGMDPAARSNNVIQNRLSYGKEIAEAKALIKEAVQDANQTFDKEAALVNKDQLNQKETAQANSVQTRQKSDKQPSEQALATAAAANASEETDRLEKKKRKLKETKLEKKLEMLGSLEDLIDESMLNEEEKETLHVFFSNINRMKQLKRNYNQLSKEEEHLLALLDQKTDKE